MCKKIFQGLMGGGGSKQKFTPAEQKANEPEVVPDANAETVGLGEFDSAGGREGSGRVKLGKGSRRGSGAAVGLSI